MGQLFWFCPLLDSTSEQLRRLMRGEQIAYYCSTTPKRSYAEGDLPEGAVVAADFQTHGHGQRDAVWHSEPGQNLLFSFLLRPRFLPPVWQFALNEAVALAVCDAIAPYFEQREVLIKWPNDLILRGKKEAGILIENSLSANTIRHSIIGVGLNVRQTSFPAELKHVTSLRKEGLEVSRNKLLERILESVEQRYLQLRNSDYHQLRKDYLSVLFRFDEWAPYRKKNGTLFEGRIVDVMKSGQLLVEHRNGEQETFAFKEVEFIY